MNNYELFIPLYNKYDNNGISKFKDFILSLD